MIEIDGEFFDDPINAHPFCIYFKPVDPVEVYKRFAVGGIVYPPVENNERIWIEEASEINQIQYDQLSKFSLKLKPTMTKRTVDKLFRPLLKDRQ